jgi:tetratricopeptide (TPR) repeat protein
VAVAALTLLGFWAAVDAEFLFWDDGENIYNNLHIRALSAENLRWMFTDLEQALRYKPLSWLAWACLHAVAGLKPAAYHLANVLLHTANAAMVFFLLRALMRGTASDEADGPTSWCAAGGALFWSLHPLRVEPVAWATGLPYELSLLFALGMMLCYWRFASAPATPAAKPFLMAAGTCFVLAVMTYPITIGLAVTPLVMDWWLGQRRASPGPWLRLRHLPFLLAAGALAATALFGRYERSTNYPAAATLEEFTLLHRVMQSFYVWALFVWRNGWTAGLSPLYYDLVNFDPLSWPFVASAVGVLGVSGLLFVRRARWPTAWAAWLCHLAWLVPVLGLTDYPHYPSDRYTYAGGLIAGLAFAACLRRGAASGRARVVAVGACAVLVLLASQSAALVPVWKDTPRHHQHLISTLDTGPRRSVVWLRLGYWHQLQRAFAEAEAAYRQALPGARDLPDLYQRLASVIHEQGRLPEARPYYESAIKGGRVSDELLGDYAITLVATGDPVGAERQLAAAVQLAPCNPRHRHNWALTLKRLGRDAEAATQEAEAQRLSAAQPPAR